MSSTSRVRRTVERLSSLPAEAAIGVVWVYQWLVSPLLGSLFGRVCRFQPSCSQYMIGALRKYGFVRGVWKGTARICRCHPWHPGGYDPP